MRIYLKTPLINKSKIIPHLVEHCAWHPAKNSDKYFKLSYWLDAVTCIDYTYFEFDNRVDYKEAIKSLISPITEKSFLYEKEIIQQELEDLSYGQRIYEYVVKKYLDSDFSMNQYEKASRKNVKDYHEKYYTPDNIIVVEDTNNYKIIQAWFKAEKNNKNLTNKISKKAFNFENDKYLLYIWKFTDWTWYWEMYFFFRMICFFSAYIQRWQKWEYYYIEPCFYEYEDNCIVIIWDYDYSTLDEKFFGWWKKYIIDMVEKGEYFKEKFFLNEYIYWIPKTREDVIDLYKSYSRETFTKALKK